MNFIQFFGTVKLIARFNQVKFGTVNKFEEYKFLCSRFTGNDMIEDYCRMQYTLNDMRVLFFFFVLMGRVNLMA